MRGQRWIVLGTCVLAGMAIVLLLGSDYRNDVLAFLRALARSL